jgi:hypothetical protein
MRHESSPSGDQSLHINHHVVMPKLTFSLEVYFVRIVIAFARSIVAASAQNRRQKRRPLPDTLSVHHSSAFCCPTSRRKDQEINGFWLSGLAVNPAQKSEMQTRQEFWQDAFSLNLAFKPAETLFTTAILAEKRR